MKVLLCAVFCFLVADQVFSTVDLAQKISAVATQQNEAENLFLRTRLRNSMKEASENLDHNPQAVDQESADKYREKHESVVKPRIGLIASQNTGNTGNTGKCSPGYYRSSGDCILCPSGKYSSEFNAIECTTCTGFVIDGDCRECDMYSIKKNGRCEVCPGAMKPVNMEICGCPVEMIEVPQNPFCRAQTLDDCEKGTYFNQLISTCAECPDRYFSSVDKATACTECPASHFPNQARTACLDVELVPAYLAKATDMLVLIIFAFSLSWKSGEKRAYAIGLIIFFQIVLIVVALTGVSFYHKGMVIFGISFAAFLLVYILLEMIWLETFYEPLLVNRGYHVVTLAFMIAYFSLRVQYVSTNGSLFSAQMIGLIVMTVGITFYIRGRVVSTQNNMTSIFTLTSLVIMLCIIFAIVSVIAEADTGELFSDHQLSTFALAVHTFGMMCACGSIALFALSKIKERLSTRYYQCNDFIIESEETIKAANAQLDASTKKKIWPKFLRKISPAEGYFYSLRQLIQKGFEMIESGDCLPLDEYVTSDDFTRNLINEVFNNDSDKANSVAKLIGIESLNGEAEDVATQNVKPGLIDLVSLLEKMIQRIQPKFDRENFDKFSQKTLMGLPLHDVGIQALFAVGIFFSATNDIINDLTSRKSHSQQNASIHKIWILIGVCIIVAIIFVSLRLWHESSDSPTAAHFGFGLQFANCGQDEKFEDGRCISTSGSTQPLQQQLSKPRSMVHAVLGALVGSKQLTSILRSQKATVKSQKSQKPTVKSQTSQSQRSSVKSQTSQKP